MISLFKNKRHTWKQIGVVLLIFTPLFFALAPLPLSANVELPFENPTNFNPEVTDLQGTSDAGSQQIQGVMASLVTFGQYFIGVLAFSWFVFSAIRMVTAGDKEDQAKDAIRGMTYSITALIMVVLVEPIITNTLYGGGNFTPGDQFTDGETIQGAIDAGTAQIKGLIDWLEAVIVFLGVLYLTFSAWKVFIDFGEDEISKQRTVILWIIVGFFVIALNDVIIEEVLYRTVLQDAVNQHGREVLAVQFSQNPTRGIAEFVGIMKYILQFLAVIAVAMAIYAGVLMITSFANEENQEKGKKILIGSGIGFLIILLSYVMVSSISSGSIL